MVRFGLVLLIVGLVTEAISVHRFRRFFDLGYPKPQVRWDDEWIKVKVVRATIVIGATVLLVGLLADLAD
jgi:hypothetical protein